MNTQDLNQKNPISLEGRRKTLSSPKDLGEHLKITSVPTYLISLTIILLLGAFVVWGFWGSVTHKVNYNGVVFPEKGTYDISLPNKGLVSKMLVHHGDCVKKGDPVAIVTMGNSHSILTSTKDGTVIYTMLDDNEFYPFKPIVSLFARDEIDNIWEHNTVIAYVDFSGQHELRVGMDAEVWPEGEKREEIGYVRSRIVDIDRYPIDIAGVKNRVKSAELAEKLLGSGKLMYRVKIEMMLEPGDSTRLCWTFGEPQDVLMDVGTYCSVLTETRRVSMFQFLFEAARERVRNLRFMIE